MTLNEKPWPSSEKYQFRDTVVTLSNGEVLNQTFFYDKVEKKGKTGTKTVRYFKGTLVIGGHSSYICQLKRFFIIGIRRILQEQNQWLCDLEGKPWKLNCGNPFAGKLCCARHFLETRPDFKNQKTALQEVVESAGHIFELYPKYHCECNWIEMYWGAAKREARIKCDYTFKSLDANINTFLDNASDIKQIRRYFQHCMNYVDAYSQFENGYEVSKDVLKIRN